MENTQEVKTISYKEYIHELHKLQKKYEDHHSHVSVFELGNVYEDSPIQVGVNWASIGTVSPEKAEEFAHALSEAIKDSRNFKYNGYVIDWYAPSERNH